MPESFFCYACQTQKPMADKVTVRKAIVRCTTCAAGGNGQPSIYSNAAKLAKYAGAGTEADLWEDWCEGEPVSLILLDRAAEARELDS